MGLAISVLKSQEALAGVMLLKGDLDTQTYQDFKDKTKEQFSRGIESLILDLSLLDYISSMGISALIDIRKTALAQGITLLLSNIPPHIDKVFKIVNALPDIAVFENIEEADRYLMSMQKRIKENP